MCILDILFPLVWKKTFFGSSGISEPVYDKVLCSRVMSFKFNMFFFVETFCSPKDSEPLFNLEDGEGRTQLLNEASVYTHRLWYASSPVSLHVSVSHRALSDQLNSCLNRLADESCQDQRWPPLLTKHRLSAGWRRRRSSCLSCHLPRRSSVYDIHLW